MASTSDSYISDSSRTASELELAQGLRAEYQQGLAENENKSLFRKAIDFASSAYHGQELALLELNELSMKHAVLKEKGLLVDNDNVLRQEARDFIQRYRDASVREKDSYSVIGGAVKTFALLAPGRTGYILSGLSFGLDEHRGTGARLDFLQGISKGLATKRMMSAMGQAQLSVPVQALGLGIGGRFIDAALSREKYLDSSGRLNLVGLESGSLKVLSQTFDPFSMAADLASFGLAHTLLRPAGALLAENARLRMAGVGAIYGFSGGLTEEASRQWNKGELDLFRLAAFPAAKAIAGGGLSYPAGSRIAELERLHKNRTKTLDMEYLPVSMSNAELKQLSSGSAKPVALRLSPLGADAKLQPERVFFVQARTNAKSSEYAAKTVSQAPSDPVEPAQIRFIYRNRNGGDNIWNLQLKAPGERSVEELLQTPSTRLRTLFYFGGRPPGLNLEGLSEPAVKVLGSGMQSVAIELASGGVLKLSKGPWEREWGHRPFDARLLSPLTQFKDINKTPEQTLNLYVQEPVVTARFSQYTKASENIEKGREFRFYDPKPAQVGNALRADGEHTVLIDYASVIRR